MAASARIRRVPWLGIAALCALVFGLVPQASVPAAAATYDLWGDGSLGWGLTSASIASPGPLLLVTVGEIVTLNLYSADDPISHTWCIDRDASGFCEAAENVSLSFASATTPLVHTFVVTGPAGTFNYVCGIHGSIPMRGPIQIVAPSRPVVSVNSPNGSESWTGGSAHDVVWTMTDPDGPVGSLVAYVNYTDGPTTTPIAGPVPGTVNPHRAAWTLPLVNTTTAAVNVTVIDAAGNRGWATQPVPRIDSAPPVVVAKVPDQGATGVSTATNVIITFDDAMNATATAAPATVSLQDTVTMSAVPVTYGWDPGFRLLTLDPIADLAPNRLHTVTVNSTARDASEPGNALAGAVVWAFTTGSLADVTRPQFLAVSAVPAVQEWGLPTNLSASVTDDDRVLSAWADVAYPDSSTTNRSMTPAGGSTWSLTDTFPQLGDYLFHVAAVDPSGNWNRSGLDSFRLVDTTAPVVGPPSATSPAVVYNPVNVTVAATDPFLADVMLDVAGSNQSMSRDPLSGKWYREYTPSEVRTYAFVITAQDTSLNRAVVSGQVNVLDTKPPSPPQSLVAAVAPGDVGIDLTWNQVSAPDLAGYNVYRDTSPTGTFATQVANRSAGTAFRDADARAGVTYYYRVTAVDLRGHESNTSNIASATLPALPVDYLPYAVAAALAIVAFAAVGAFLVLRRRRQKGA